MLETSVQVVFQSQGHYYLEVGMVDMRVNSE